MLKTTYLSIVLFVAFSCSVPKNVFLCDSSGGKKYHYSNKCRGLSNCQYKIIQVTLEQAKKDGKTLCKWED